MSTMKRVMSGLYAGDDVRAERNDDGTWKFQVRLEQIGRWIGRYEYRPDGIWTPIGSWKTLHGGLDAAQRLRAGTHFWDSTTSICRLWSEEAYASVREAEGQ